MARFRKTLYLIVEGCVLVTLSVTAGVLVLHENVFRQLPLYCFLEEKVQERSAGQDHETYEKLIAEFRTGAHDKKYHSQSCFQTQCYEYI